MAESDPHPLPERPAALSSIDVIASTVDPGLGDLGQVSSPDGAVTLLLADIDEAAAVEQQLGAERWEARLRDQTALVGQLVGHHSGEVVKTDRDGFLATFPSAHAGLHCAVELQQALAAGSAELPGGLRAGLHSGFVIANPDQLLGRNVVLAARIAALARGGEILISAALKQYTESDPSFRFEERGEFHFKGLHGQHDVFAVRWEEPGAG